jgi:hypothetical protein
MTLDTDTTDKSCQINIHNVLGWDLDHDMFNEALKVCVNNSSAKLIDIYPQERVPADAPVWKNPGWLEWVVRIHYRAAGTLEVHIIQRQLGAPFERHS